MIVLASFPRSGNTFLRNILFEAFGLESSTYHLLPGKKLNPNYNQYPVVKTHLLPHQLPADLRSRPAVYIVRDGRDAVVSLAHHRSDIVEPGSDFENNLIEAILAQQGSHFGGWSENVKAWSIHASLILRFEDLIQNPMQEVLKLKSLLDLPEPDPAKIPTFRQLKFGKPRYGSTYDRRPIAEQFFRKGRSNAWKEEMSPGIYRLFMSQHGQLIRELGYEDTGKSAVSPVKKVLLEGTKFLDDYLDGVSRYVSELVHHYPILTKHQNDWEIDLLIGDKVFELVRPDKAIDPNLLRKELLAEYQEPDRYLYEHILLALKKTIKKVIPANLYNRGRLFYINGPFRSQLLKLRQIVGYQKVKPFSNTTESLQKDFYKYDLAHAPLPQNLPNVTSFSKKYLVTVHDLTHFSHNEYHQVDNIVAAEEGFKQINEDRCSIISISENTRKDLEHLIDPSNHNIYTIPQGFNPEKFHPKLRNDVNTTINGKYGLPDNKFILCLSTIEPRKNLANTIKAFTKFIEDNDSVDISLVIAGRNGWKYHEIDQHESNPRIYFTGYIHDDDLAYIYARSHIFSYVSHYEGFGLPLLEAMGSGTPVVYGANSSMQEIVGNAGIPCNPNDPDSIATAFQTLLCCTETWKKYSERGRQCANQYTWIKTAFNTLEVYRQIIEEGG
jgi:glycosyltransferase involved in cell wall biosynthesis